jgi:hypothetical protein
MVELLISRGADFNAVDKKGSSALVRASINGHLDVVRFLLARGAEVNLRDNDGLTPLSYASLRDDREMIEHLIGSGAEVPPPSDSGEGSYVTAVSYRAVAMYHERGGNTEDVLENHTRAAEYFEKASEQFVKRSQSYDYGVKGIWVIASLNASGPGSTQERRTHRVYTDDSRIEEKRLMYAELSERSRLASKECRRIQGCIRRDGIDAARGLCEGEAAPFIVEVRP